MDYKLADKVRIVVSLVFIVTGLVVERYSNVWPYINHSDLLLLISFMLLSWGALLIGYAWGHHEGRSDGRGELAREILRKQKEARAPWRIR